ncbi:MAG: hypothetical protein F6K23_26095 [Okeania sp. SIO2C9]|uniref:hypothetical protein n=1 Tax=Okeania sp. SIO2C9 TaxID=2607791 RepID=UPI0013BFB524|nr:hypothetical protein [Okeania sp. SIO2C9]NEQ76203.1 hypothetical protein [Okeania sp. SIO2C9]
MSSTDQGQSPNKQTIKADDDLIERAKEAMQELEIYTKIELAEIAKLSRSTINKFFQKQEIRRYSYDQICETLLLNEKIVKREEIATFTITGSIDKKRIEDLEVIIKLLEQLSSSDLKIAIREKEDDDVK